MEEMVVQVHQITLVVVEVVLVELLLTEQIQVNQVAQVVLVFKLI